MFEWTSPIGGVVQSCWVPPIVIEVRSKPRREICCVVSLVSNGSDSDDFCCGHFRAWCKHTVAKQTSTGVGSFMVILLPVINMLYAPTSICRVQYNSRYGIMFLLLHR